MIFPSFEAFNDLAQAFNVIPVCREVRADLHTPVSIFSRFAKEKGNFLLESVEKGENVGRYSLLGRHPFLELKAYGNRILTIQKGECIEQNGCPLELIAKKLTEYKAAKIKGLPPFCGGAVGYFGYDTVRYIEKLPEQTTDVLGLPDIHLLFFKETIVYDHVKNSILFITNVKVDENAAEAYEEGLQELEAIMAEFLANTVVDEPEQFHDEAAQNTTELTSNMEEKDYCEKVCRAKQYIKDGDVFQVVLSQRLEAATDSNPFEVYRRLRYINPSPYMFYIDFGDYQVVGSSPEMLVRSMDGYVETNPIAGTRPRGNSIEEDQALAKDLIEDPKEIAEHMMLLDLGRNDIGRVAEFGSVQVPDYLQIEKYSHVMHIVSRVKGKLKADATSFDALAACFPAGTVSGAPKVRAMEIIEELEQDKRGVYGGAVGHMSFTGEMDLCIAIRTIVFKEGIAHIQAGAGIVADSIPENEYQETLRKATALLKVL